MTGRRAPAGSASARCRPPRAGIRGITPSGAGGLGSWCKPRRAIGLDGVLERKLVLVLFDVDDLHRSPKVEETLPVLYLRGLSTGDFEPALKGLLGEEASGLSAAKSTASSGCGKRSGKPGAGGASRMWTTCTCGSMGST